MVLSDSARAEPHSPGCWKMEWLSLVRQPQQLWAHEFSSPSMPTSPLHSSPPWSLPLNLSLASSRMVSKPYGVSRISTANLWLATRGCLSALDHWWVSALITTHRTNRLLWWDLRATLLLIHLSQKQELELLGDVKLLEVSFTLVCYQGLSLLNASG